MTLPTDIIYPFRPAQITSKDPNDLKVYLYDLIFKMTRVYQDQVEIINGNIREYTATILGSTVAGTGTYNYQTGVYLRQGLMVDYWFDISWSAHTGAGNLEVLLPYKVKAISNNVWLGSVSTSNITYPAGYIYPSIICLQDDTSAIVKVNASGLAESNIGIPASGILKGHVRYIGQEFN